MGSHSLLQGISQPKDCRQIIYHLNHILLWYFISLWYLLLVLLFYLLLYSLVLFFLDEPDYRFINFVCLLKKPAVAFTDLFFFLFFLSLHISTLVYPSSGFPGDTSDKESACQCRRHKRYGFDHWVRKIPWSRSWQPSEVSLPGKFHGQSKSLESYLTWATESQTWMNDQTCILLLLTSDFAYSSFSNSFRWRVRLFIRDFSCFLR